MKKLTASKLREDIYRILDKVVETGIPVEVERNGTLLRIVPATPNPTGRLKTLKSRKLIKGDPIELVSLDWSKEWSEYK